MQRAVGPLAATRDGSWSRWWRREGWAQRRSRWRRRRTAVERRERHGRRHGRGRGALRAVGELLGRVPLLDRGAPFRAIPEGRSAGGEIDAPVRPGAAAGALPVPLVGFG